MTTQPLILALVRLADGSATLDERAQVGRQLVDELGLPSEVVENLLNDDLYVDEARFLLTLLGPDDGFSVSLCREISSEAGRFEASRRRLLRQASVTLSKRLEPLLDRHQDLIQQIVDRQTTIPAASRELLKVLESEEDMQ